MSGDRHDALIAAGWRYDADQDRYTSPDKVQAGTERWYNLDAAWSAYQQAAQQQSKSGRRTRAKDPREQEPQ